MGFGGVLGSRLRGSNLSASSLEPAWFRGAELFLGAPVYNYPDPRGDLESRSPNLGPSTTKGTL